MTHSPEGIWLPMGTGIAFGLTAQTVFPVDALLWWLIATLFLLIGFAYEIDRIIEMKHGDN